MSQPHSPHALGLLQFEVDGQTFAIAVTDLAGVEQRQDLALADAGLGASQRPTHAPLVDLGQLFFGKSRIPDGGSVLIARAGTQVCALLVDRVLPGTVVPGGERQPMPDTLVNNDLPFSGMFFKPDQWVLIVDTPRLVEWIGGLDPTAVVEASHEHVG